jgi:hypothetical protein
MKNESEVFYMLRDARGKYFVKRFSSWRATIFGSKMWGKPGYARSMAKQAIEHPEYFSNGEAPFEPVKITINNVEVIPMEETKIQKSKSEVHSFL